jgi:hypothetical protein
LLVVVYWIAIELLPVIPMQFLGCCLSNRELVLTLALSLSLFPALFPEEVTIHQALFGLVGIWDLR